jgi:hypothetical protein
VARSSASGRVLWLAYTLTALFVLEVCTGLYALAVGGFRWQLGPLRISADDPAWPFTLAMLFGVAAFVAYRWRAPSAIEWDRLSSWSRGAVVAALLLLLALPFMRPLAIAGYPDTHDVGWHLSYTYRFDRALHQGQFPVRWVEDVHNGWGQPLFNFYQVGLYYTVEAVHIVVPSLARSLKLTLLLMWGAGGLFMFLVFRRIGFFPGLAAAIMFSTAPYLLLDMYVRGAYPEFVAFCLAPAMLWTIDGYLRTATRSFLVAFSFVAALSLIVHLPTVVITTPAWAMYIVFLRITRETSTKRILMLVPATLLALMIASFYVWPALLEQSLVNIAKVTSDVLDFHRHFVDPGEWARFWIWGYVQEEMSFQIGIGQWIVLGAAAILLSRAIRDPRVKAVPREILCWLVIISFALFMTTASSLRVWEAVKPLSFIQFPWRFMIVVTIGFGALSALVVSLVPGRTWQAVVVACLAFTQWYVSRDYLALVHLRNRVVMNIDDPDWRNSNDAFHRAPHESGYDPASSSTLVAEDDRWHVVYGMAAVDERVIKDDQLVLDVATAGAQIVIRSAFMPGWKTWIDKVEANPAVEPRTGWMRLSIPSGNHRVDARFTNTRVRAASNAVSAAGVALWLGWAVATAARRRHLRLS